MYWETDLKPSQDIMSIENNWLEEELNLGNHQLISFFVFYFIRGSSTLAAQAGAQWHDLGLLQPPLPRFK